MSRHCVNNNFDTIERSGLKWGRHETRNCHLGSGELERSDVGGDERTVKKK